MRTGNRTRIFTFGLGENAHRYNIMTMARIGGGASEFVASNNPLRSQVYFLSVMYYNLIRYPNSLKEQDSHACVILKLPGVMRQHVSKPQESYCLCLVARDKLYMHSYLRPVIRYYFKFHAMNMQQVRIDACQSANSEPFHISVMSNSAEIVNGLTLHRLCARAIVRLFNFSLSFLTTKKRDWEDQCLGEDSISSEVSRQSVALPFAFATHFF